MTTTKRAPARTAQQIAQDKVDKAQAKVDALTERGAKVSMEAHKIYAELAATEKKLAFLKSDPDLVADDPAQTSIDDALDEEPAVGGEQ